jgi:hypothetical protein
MQPHLHISVHIKAFSMRTQLRAEKYLQIMCNIFKNAELNFILYTA